MPYLLFSHTKTQGRFHSLACKRLSTSVGRSTIFSAHHVERLEDLTLVGGTIAIQAECDGILLLILVRESDACTHWYLRAHDTVPAKEGGGEDMHGATFTMRHACLTTQQLSYYSFDGATSENGEGMAAI